MLYTFYFAVTQLLLVFAVERDPSKRRVKPVEPHLLQLDFAGIGSSSDDSDFKVVTDDDSGSHDLPLYCRHIFCQLSHVCVYVCANLCSLF